MSQRVPGVRLTRVHAIVAPPQQVGELVAAFALAVAPWRVEAQLLHQHQRLLTQFFIPVPRHPPIRIALLTSSRSQRWHGPRRTAPFHLEQGLRWEGRGGRRSGGGWRLDHRDQVPMYERATPLSCPTVPGGDKMGGGGNK